MKIPAWVFLTFWAVISITFLHLGFRALEKTELSDSVVPPFVMFLFKHSLTIVSCFSSTYALKFRSQSRYAVRSNGVLLFYLFFSVVFPRTVEGILIWHVVKVIVAWLLYFLLKLKLFFAMIFRVLALLFDSIIWYVFTFILIIGFIIVPFVVYHFPWETISFIFYTAGMTIFGLTLGYLSEIILSYKFIGFFLRVLNLLLHFLGTCFAYLVIILAIFFAIVGIFYVTVVSLTWLCVSTREFLLFCKNNFSELKTRAGILLALELSLFFISAKKSRNFSPILALSISHFICVVWAELATFRDYTVVSDGDKLLHIAAKVAAAKMRMILSMLKEHRVNQFIEFAVGTVCAVLFQYFFKMTSFSEVKAFLCLTVAWLANLVLLGFPTDFGVFSFLLTNAVAGSAVGQFGLHRLTLQAVGAALLLYGLRLMLEKIAVAYQEGQHIQLSLFGNDRPTAPLHHIPRTSEI